MKSKVWVAAPAPAQPKYPGLYASNRDSTFGFIVLMHSEGQGTVLAKGGSDYEVGHYSELWEMRTFSPITVPTTIEFN